MEPHNFKPGDYVFHFNDDRGSLGCIVTKVGRGDRIRVSAHEGHSMWVNARKCQLQSEWAKEYEA